MATASVNRIVLIGNLGADPELRWLPSGDPVAHLSIATTDRRANGAGGFEDATEWHRASVYGKQAEVAARYLKKGSQVFVEGKIRSSKWIDRSGAERKSWFVAVQVMQMLGKRETTSEEHGAAAGTGMGWMDRDPPAHPREDSAAPDSGPNVDDDIPF